MRICEIRSPSELSVPVTTDSMLHARPLHLTHCITVSLHPMYKISPSSAPTPWKSLYSVSMSLTPFSFSFLVALGIEATDPHAQSILLFYLFFIFHSVTGFPLGCPGWNGASHLLASVSQTVVRLVMSRPAQLSLTFLDSTRFHAAFVFLCLA